MQAHELVDTEVPACDEPFPNLKGHPKELMYLFCTLPANHEMFSPWHHSEPYEEFYWNLNTSGGHIHTRYVRGKRQRV